MNADGAYKSKYQKRHRFPGVWHHVDSTIYIRGLELFIFIYLEGDRGQLNHF